MLLNCITNLANLEKSLDTYLFFIAFVINGGGGCLRLPQILGPTALAISKPVTKTPDLIIFSVLQENTFGKSEFVVREYGKWLKLHP